MKPRALSFAVVALAGTAAGCESANTCCTADPTTCVQPPLAPGDECVFDWDCPRQTSCFAGACRDLGGDGAGCARHSDCEATLRCSCDSSDCGQREELCHPPGTRSLGEPCYSDSSCGEGVCNWTLGYVCSQPGDVGQTCLSQTDCRDGLACNWGLDPHVCAEPAAQGERCTRDRDCAEGLACLWPTGDASGGPKQCVARGFAVGDACDSHTCGQELFCDLSSQTCTAPAPLGAPCEGGCELGLVCNYGIAEGVCAEPQSADTGEPCWMELDCRDGLLCIDGSCREPGHLAAGEVCRQDGDCGGGLRCGYPSPEKP